LRSDSLFPERAAKVTFSSFTTSTTQQFISNNFNIDAFINLTVYDYNNLSANRNFLATTISTTTTSCDISSTIKRNIHAIYRSFPKPIYFFNPLFHPCLSIIPNTITTNTSPSTLLFSPSSPAKLPSSSGLAIIFEPYSFEQQHLILRFLPEQVYQQSFPLLHPPLRPTLPTLNHKAPILVEVISHMSSTTPSSIFSSRGLWAVSFVLSST